MELSPTQRAALASICDTFAPGDGADIPSASELGAVAVAEAMAGGNPRASERRQLATVLTLWNTRLWGLFLGIGLRRFRDLPAPHREKALLALSDARSPMKRTLFGNLKAAAMISYYTTPGPEGHSPLWTAMGYPGPSGVRADAPEPPLHPVSPQGDVEAECDVVVVGSGAGGGTAAAVLAAAGLRVIVLEKGHYFDDRDFDGGELKGLGSLYASRPQATAEGQLSVLSGECLGGGTVINYTTSFRTPAHVRAEWAGLGATTFEDAAYDEAMDAVWERLGVTTAHSALTSRDAILERGATALGWHVGTLERNVRGCADDATACGTCAFGCRVGAKQSVTKTWLADAEAAGARLFTGVDVRSVDVSEGRATGVTGRTADGHRVSVRARAVIAAGGSIQTPALLRRSGLKNPNIGKHLRLHPATAVWAEFDEEVRQWEGAIQTRFSDEHADLDGSGYGVVYETAAANPAASVGFLAWRGAADHLATMRALGRLSHIGVITRDQDSGDVETARDGEPVLHYTLSDRDRARMEAGVAGAARILEAAGATRIFSGHQAGVSWERASGEDLDTFLARAHDAGYGPGQCAIAALHIMGSARMGGSPAQSAADPHGATWEVPNLVIADASAFPTSCGVNPMVTIEALAYMNAKTLAARLTAPARRRTQAPAQTSPA